MPKVSVIIPNYNHAPYLRQRIKSVLDQTFQDFDLTYLDDASNDDSNAVFAEFETQSRIKAIYNERNSGSPFKQWNKGIRATEGEYVWIAESDDVADPNFLATLVPLLDQNPNVGLAYCQSCQIDSNNVVIKQTMTHLVEDLSLDRWNHDFVANGINEIQKYLIFKNTIPNASAVLIRRAVYELIGGAEESLLLGGDWLTWFKILLKSDIAFSTRVLNSFRIHRSSVRSKSNLGKTQIDEYLFIRQVIESSIQIPAETLAIINEDLVGRLIDNWIHSTLSGENSFNLKVHAEFYKMISEKVSHPEFILLKRLAWYIRCQITEQVKHWVPKSIKNKYEKLK
jgi:glycosyltransferase involved in cell wall biosynthesis